MYRLSGKALPSSHAICGKRLKASKPETALKTRHLMAVVVDDVDRAGVYARSPQGRRVQPAATNRHSHTSTRRWCVGGLAVKQDAYDRSRDFPAQINRPAAAMPVAFRCLPSRMGGAAPLRRKVRLPKRRTRR